MWLGLTLIPMGCPWVLLGIFPFKISIWNDPAELEFRQIQEDKKMTVVVSADYRTGLAEFRARVESLRSSVSGWRFEED